MRKSHALLSVAAVALIVSATNPRPAAAIAGIDTAAIVGAIQTAQNWLTDQILGGFDFSAIINKMGFDNLQKASVREMGAQAEIADANNKIAQAARQQEHQVDTVLRTMPSDNVCADATANEDLLVVSASARGAATAAARSAAHGLLGKGDDPRRFGAVGTISLATNLDRDYGNRPDNDPLQNAHIDPSFIFDENTASKVKTKEEAAQHCAAFAFNAVDPFTPPDVRDSELNKEGVKNAEVANNVRRNAALTAQRAIMEVCMNQISPVEDNGKTLAQTIRDQIDEINNPERVIDGSVSADTQALKDLVVLQGRSLDLQLRMLEKQDRDSLVLARMLTSIQQLQNSRP